MLSRVIQILKKVDCIADLLSHWSDGSLALLPHAPHTWLGRDPLAGRPARRAPAERTRARRRFEFIAESRSKCAHTKALAITKHASSKHTDLENAAAAARSETNGPATLPRAPKKATEKEGEKSTNPEIIHT